MTDKHYLRIWEDGLGIEYEITHPEGEPVEHCLTIRYKENDIGIFEPDATTLCVSKAGYYSEPVCPIALEVSYVGTDAFLGESGQGFYELEPGLYELEFVVEAYGIGFGIPEYESYVYAKPVESTESEGSQSQPTS